MSPQPDAKTPRAMDMRRGNGPHGDRTRQPCLQGTALHQIGGSKVGWFGWKAKAKGLGATRGRRRPTTDVEDPLTLQRPARVWSACQRSQCPLLTSVVQTSAGISPSNSGMYPEQISPGRCFPSVITKGRFP